MNLVSKTVRLRLIEKKDTQFALSLRASEQYNTYLAAIYPDVNAQAAWFKQYKVDEAQGLEYCFIIERTDGVPCGTVRVFDLQADSFSWGTWILNQDKTLYAAIESAFLVYRFGFEQLGYQHAHFAVMKGNDKVRSFHQKMGAVQTAEDKLDIFYSIDKASVLHYQQRLSKILT